MISRLYRKVKRVLGIKPQMLFVHDGAQTDIAVDVKIENSRIEIAGKSSLKIAAGCVLKNCNIKLKDTTFSIGANCGFHNLNIFVTRSSIMIGDMVSIRSYDFTLDDASLTIDDNNVLYQGRSALRPFISIAQGSLLLLHHNVIKCDFWIRFYGNCRVGTYNCINERTEVRCDEQVTIGSYNMISYECNIWDTNTHNIYPIEKRHQITEKDFPCIGSEFERPITKSVSIADDCWVGKRVNILKGTQLEQGTIVGIGTTMAGQTLKPFEMAVTTAARILHKS